MLKQLWRKSHLFLAIFSSIFLLITSLTGGLLAFEPILNKTKPYQVNNTNKISIADLIGNIQKTKTPFSSIKNRNNGHIIVSFTNGKYYVNSKGDKLQKTVKQKSFFKFLTKLHRSLFYKTTGRIIIGIVSFLLFLISITGTLLILKRQKGIKALFTPIIKENKTQYYHTNLGRLLLIPIIVISLTGTYLSLKRFKIVDTKKIKLKVSNQTIINTHKDIATFAVFKNNTISNLKELKFPFSNDKDEYFHLKLKDKEVLINQYNGNVIDEQYYPFSKIVSLVSFDLHTGYFGVIWAFILIITSFSILYFMYSGFSIAYLRFKVQLKNKFTNRDAEYIILYGSENGTTKSYAKILYEAYLMDNKKVFVNTLNKYQNYPKMKHLIVLTSTYGEGKAPANASDFILKVQHTNLNNQNYLFSVIGFGSLSYPKFCEFAKNIDITLSKKENTKQFIPLTKINNKSIEQFTNWMNLWNDKSKNKLKLDLENIKNRKKSTSFEVINRTLDKKDNSFLLELKPNGANFTSGDIIGIYPDKTTHERLYSIAEIHKRIVLSIKIHEKGFCSNYLNDITIGSSIDAFIIKNKDFHFPKKATKVIMIATGTGIAPFLGMITNNKQKKYIDLYFGVQNENSLNLYNNIIHEGLQNNELHNFKPAFSRKINEQKYVQDLITDDIEFILKTLQNKGVIMICGSIMMQNDILALLESSLIKIGKSVSYYKNRKQILLDCY